jgi:glycosyltransferase involved in cell wall biosynthesis
VVEEAGAGLCVPAQDAAALAAAIERLADMPAPVRDAMGRRGRAYYLEHFEPERLARRLLELFAPLAGGRGAMRDPAAAVRGDTPEAR